MYATSQRNPSLELLMQSLTGGHTADPTKKYAMTNYSPLFQNPGVGMPVPQKPSFFKGILDNMAGAGLDLANKLSNLPQPEPDPLEALTAMLAQQLNGSGSGLNQADYEQALNDSAAQIKKGFGAQIGAIKASSANARHQTKRSKKQIKAMYKALSKEYNKAAVAEVAQGKDIANTLQGITDTSQQGVNQSANESLDNQAALAKSLGVESAAPSILAKQQGETQKVVQRMGQIGQDAENLQMANSGAQQRFLNSGGTNALLEGTNRRADLVQQLQAFLQENLGKIADVKAARGQALASNQASIADKFGSAASGAADDKFDNGLALAKFLLEIQKSKQQPQGPSNLPPWMQRQQEVVGNDSQVSQLLDNLFASPEFTTQTFRQDKQDFRMNPIKAGDLAYQAAIEQGLSQAQATAAKLAAMFQQQGLG